MYVPIPSHPSSTPRARELGYEIDQTIEEFERLHPDTHSSDIRQALQIAGADGGRRRRAAGLAVGLLVSVVLGLIVAFTLGGAPPSDAIETTSILTWLIGGLAVLLAVVAIARTRGR